MKIHRKRMKVIVCLVIVSILVTGLNLSLIHI